MSEPRKYPGMLPAERTVYEPYSSFEIPADLRELHGRYDVDAIAQRVRNFRYAEEWTMMILGGWLATIPELPAKTGLGKIIWESAQAADALGNRLPELRCGRKASEQSEVANEGFAALIQEIACPEDPDLTIEKLVGVFEVLKPHLVSIYEESMSQTDAISDAPTIEILSNVVRMARSHIDWGREVLDTLCKDAPERQKRREERREALSQLLIGCGGVIGSLPGADH